MHHTPAQIPTGMTFLEASSSPAARWSISGQDETFCMSLSARYAYLDFMDHWRWLALNGTD